MIAHLLGTGSANAGPSRTTTMLAVERGEHLMLIDCGGDAVQRMLACGLDPTSVDAIVLTHEHPDHLSGFPLLIEKLWLLGRRAPLDIYGPAPTLVKAETVFGVFDTEHWDGLPERRYRPVEMTPGAAVLTLGDAVVTAAPVEHPVPTIGLRFEAPDETLAYSGDTAISDTVVRLARGADVLIHEGTGSLPGVHSSPEEAARVAARSGSGRLILVHAPADASEEGLESARAVFPATSWGVDGQRIEVRSASEQHPRAR